MYPGHQAPYHQTVTGFLHHSPLPALPPSHLPPPNNHQHFQNNTSGDANDSDSAVASASAASILLFESRQTNRELRLQLTDAQLKLDRLLAKVDEIGSERSSDVALRNSSYLSSNALGFEPKSSYFQLTKENDELKSRLSEMTIKLQSHQDNISSLLDSNQKLLEQNVDLMGRSFDSLGNQSKQTTSQEAMLMNSLNAAASEERDTMRVELASMRTREIECQRQIEKLIKMDQENKMQLQQTDLQLKDWSQTMDRLNAELSEEKRRRKEAEMTSRALATDAEETKAKNGALQKALSDLKTSSKSKIMELENDVKSLQDNHQKELSLVKERFRKDKSRVQEDHSEMLRQTEENLKSSWKRKYENLEKTLKDRHSLQLDELSSERSFLVDRVSSMEQKMAELKSQRTAEESNRTALLSEMEEYKAWKTKYDNLRTQAISMKDRYTNQIEGLKEESSLQEEKCNRMTDKYYKAEESLSVATQKYEEFKVRSLEGRMEFEVKLHQMEAELVITKSELDIVRRREVQTQQKLDEALNEQRRLAEAFEVLENEPEREMGHVAQSTEAPLGIRERTKTQGDAVPLFSRNEDAEEVLMIGVSSCHKYEPIIEKREYAQEHEEQREPEEEDDDDDGDSFVTALGDEDAAWRINEETKDVVTCLDESLRSDGGVSRSYELQNEQGVDGHLNLRNDVRTASAVDLDIARLSIHEQDSRTGINAGDLDEENIDGETIVLEIVRGSRLVNGTVESNELNVRFDLNLEKNPQRTEVTNNGNDSGLTFPDKTGGTSCDLSNSESLVRNLSPSKGGSDVQSGDDLEETREIDLGIVHNDISEQRAVDDLQRRIQVPPPATETIATAPTLNRNLISEPSSHEAPVTTVASSPDPNGGLEHHVKIPGKQENTGDDELPSQSTAESDLQEPSFSTSSRDNDCDGETSTVEIEHRGNNRTSGKAENIAAENRSEFQSTSSALRTNESGDEETSSAGSEQRKHDGKPGELESTEAKERVSQPGIERERESTSSDIDKDGNCLDERKTEDSTYTVTSGGKIVSENVMESDGEGMAQGGWLADAESGQDAVDASLDTRVSTSKNNQHLTPSKNDPAERSDAEGTPFNKLDETRQNVESREQTGTSDGSFEDLVYTVTSGGQIVPGWTDVEDSTPEGASHVIPELDQQRLTGGATGFEVTEILEASSSTSEITEAPDAGLNPPEVGSGTLEVIETGSEIPLRKPEDPVSRFGACVILREEDIEKMRERRMNDSAEEKKKKDTKKKYKKKTGR